jgi:hypothetical protein
MSDIVSEYCELAEQGAAFNDARLARLREQMTEADIFGIKARLRAAAEADFKEANALRAWHRSRKVVPLRSPPAEPSS